jgi:hypothetical protein
VFIVQPTICFGDVIAKQLAGAEAGQPRWHALEFAVAWVRASGLDRVLESARAFLEAGGCIRATVGLDFGGTSHEGLAKLLDLEATGADIATYVFFDRSGYTFHPKIYLFSDTSRARLYVGSNNMTGGGLENNVEAALEVSGGLEDETIRVARTTLASWRDPIAEPRCKRLTAELLGKLLDSSLVRTEEQIRRQRRSESTVRSSDAAAIFSTGTTGTRTSVGVAGVRGEMSRYGSASDSVEVLLMRVRKRRNGNQIQISKCVLNGPFMDEATEVALTDGSRRRIGSNTARGNKNTERFEAPGLRVMTNPVARFRWVNAGSASGGIGKYLLLELFDADQGGEGAEILRKLKQGIGTPPLRNLKQLSRDETALSASSPENAQWYRLDVI